MYIYTAKHIYIYVYIDIYTARGASLDIHSLNVALTRAVDLFLLVGDRDRLCSVAQNGKTGNLADTAGARAFLTHWLKLDEFCELLGRRSITGVNSKVEANALEYAKRIEGKHRWKRAKRA